MNHRMINALIQVHEKGSEIVYTDTELAGLTLCITFLATCTASRHISTPFPENDKHWVGWTMVKKKKMVYFRHEVKS